MLKFYFSAFFIDDVIESDGRLHLATPVDPLLLVLPYLKSAKRHIPLDHLLEEDGDFPEAANRLVPVLIRNGLTSIANQKGLKQFAQSNHNRLTNLLCKAPTY